ncbi:MAG: class I SAM-dependent methyltransferase [Pseudomonadota bacterium]
MTAEAKISVTEGSVQETLLLPLWGRAFETGKDAPRLVDHKAQEILDRLDYDFSTIEQTQSIGQHGWVARSIQTDRVAKAFIAKHPRATIVNLGCGMDTTFSRVDNGQITFFELDFPDVIALRKQFFDEDERHRSIASSLHDTAWFEQIEPTDGLLLLAGGVFMYSSEAQIRSFFVALADHFGTCELCFDAMSPLGLQIGKKMVLKKGGLNSFQDSEGWALKSPRALETWDPRISVVSAVPMHGPVKKGTPLKTRLALSVPDWLGVARMVHLRIEADPAA